MGDIELVIKIPEVQKKMVDAFMELPPQVENDLISAIRHGTPQQKIGHWIEENVNGGRKVFCSECGGPPPFEHISTGDVYSSSGYGVINKTKFCPNCGIKMEEEE